MKTLSCDIDGPLIIEPTVFGDDRGFFLESWSEERFREAGLDFQWVQDNHSHSQKGVLRGLHFQNPGPQGKLVRVSRGAIYDVAVDLRRSRPTFGRWTGVHLSAQNKRMLWVPEGFAHGFLTLEDDTDVLYKCTARYSPDSKHVLAWDDPDIAIAWPIGDLDVILSEKDAAGLSLAQAPKFA